MTLSPAGRGRASSPDSRPRRALLVVLLGLWAAACVQSPKPNILLITLDTTRADALGLYGRSPSPSPNLDRFANTAVVYDRAYAPSSWTLPSHASVFTGLLPHQHGAGSPNPGGHTHWNARPLEEGYTTLAELLRANGYRTRAVVGGPALAPEMGTAQGFEKYDADFKTLGDQWNGKRATYVADRAIEYVRESGPGPYFVFANFFDPHRPYKPPTSYDSTLPDKPTDGLDKLVLAHLGTPAVSVDDLEPELRERIERARKSYEAEVGYMDHELARLLAAVDEVPEESRPIVVITADHGESFGEHYYTLHGAHLYEDNVRVPLIVRDPARGASGERVSRPVEIHRLFGFLLGRAGVSPPEEADAASLDAAGAPIVTEVWRTSIAVMLLGARGDRDLRALYEYPYKLIVSSTGDAELYDLDADAEELHDLTTAQPQRVDAMRSRLTAIVGDDKPLHGEAVRTEIRDSTKSALKALGYLED